MDSEPDLDIQEKIIKNIRKLKKKVSKIKKFFNFPKK